VYEGGLAGTGDLVAVRRLCADAGIAGVAKDATGGVLPGVTVEASSPALIEKSRVVVTDGQGQYKIVDLRPGTYAVTFTLSGFSAVRREGIELTAAFTATVNAELRVGSLEETITVAGGTQPGAFDNPAPDWFLCSFAAFRAARTLCGVTRCAATSTKFSCLAA